LQLLGFVRARAGDLREAERLYRHSLARKPAQPMVQANLGKLLAVTGRPEEAIPLLRAALRANPELFDALVTLGAAQKATGDAENAERHLRAALKLQPASLAVPVELGALLNEMGQPAQAEAVLREALKQPAGDAFLRAAVEHNLAVALKLQRRYDEALPLFDSALARKPDLPSAGYNRANTLAHLKRDDEAADGYRKFLGRHPGHLAAHQELNELLYRQGRDAEFLVSYDEAAAQLPQPEVLLMKKGGFLIRAERFAEAQECFARAAAALPASAEAQNGLALALSGLGQLDQAVAAYERSIALQPDDQTTRVNLAVMLLRAGEAQRALELTQDVVAHKPFDQGALAVHELALRANDDARAVALTDYDKHVRVFDLEPPPGFASMADFNDALNTYLDMLHTDRREHVDQTLRNGTQTMDPLFESDNPLIRALRVRIEEVVAHYIAGLDDGAEHPLAGRRTEGFRFTGSWSSRLYDKGFHTNHMHPRGWISSCYYVEVPDAAKDETAKQGWLKFGEPPFATGLKDPIARMVQPVPGRLVLFPSYMWHGTVRFHAPTARTTIAFDAVPI
jgi:tetratricopeptide (TPR) repeat protein